MDSSLPTRSHRANGTPTTSLHGQCLAELRIFLANKPGPSCVHVQAESEEPLSCSLPASQGSKERGGFSVTPGLSIHPLPASLLTWNLLFSLVPCLVHGCRQQKLILDHVSESESVGESGAELKVCGRLKDWSWRLQAGLWPTVAKVL